MKNGKPEVTTLQNGMRLVTVNMPAVKSITVLAMVGVGGRYEDPKHSGISHFLEHLPFKGTEKYPTSLDISTAIDGVGGKHNAYTSKDYTGYWVKVASRQGELALDMVSDLMLTARLRSKDIEQEKGVIVEEINMYEDNPQYKVSNLFDATVFAGSPLERDVTGTKETVTSIKREDFLNHWERWYYPSNIVIGIVGDIKGLRANLGDLEARVSEYFSKGTQHKGGGTKVHEVPLQTKPRLTVFHKKTEQAHFHLGFPGIGREDPDRYPLMILMTILGGNSSSWCFNEIREKRGLAYYAYASADLYAGSGCIYALEGVALDKIDEAIRVTIEQFERARAGKDLTEGEVKRAKEYVAGKLTLDLESSDAMAGMMVRRLLLEGETLSLEQMLARVRAVELDQVRAVAKRLIDMRKVNLAVIGPYKEERFWKLIGD
jgi:predicted Zn-dependent peptidase